MAVSSISEAGRFGKSKAEVHRNKQAYIHTFTSVMDYPKKAPMPAPPTSDSTATDAAVKNAAQRSQRKAKSNAINKMDITRERETTVPPSNASASGSTISKDTTPKVTLLPSVSSGLTSAMSTDTSQSTGPKPSNNPIAKKAQIPKAPALNRKSVKWSGPREPKPRDRPRLFELKECPVFYPTPEEFQDPMQYLKTIGDEGRGKEFGMCKIVPPEGWQMPFVLDTEVSPSSPCDLNETVIDCRLLSSILDLPFSNEITTIKLSGSVFSGKTQFFGSALHVSQATGQSKYHDSKS